MQPQHAESYKELVEGQFEGIIARPVGENIDDYAERAFQDLIVVVQDVLDAYDKQPTIPLTSAEDSRTLEDERRALAYFGLDPYAIESVLGHLEHIGNLDGIIADITEHVATVIVPPDQQSPLIPGGEKPFTNKPPVPRLKTFMSSLETNFNIDLQDPNQCRIKDGELTPDMMREESYKLVVLPTLQRIVLICDAAENATFVFDSSVLAALPDNPTHDQLIGMSKEQLKELIQRVPRIGYRLTYQSDRFVGHMSALMDAIPDAVAPGTSEAELGIDASDEQLLAESMPQREADGSIIGTKKLGDALGATRRMVRKAVGDLGESLGYLEQGDRKGSVRFSVAQQAMVERYLVGNQLIAPEAPEAFMSFTEMCRVFGAGTSAARLAIEACGKELGDLLDARRGPRRTKYYSPAQQEQVLNKLMQNGSAAVRARPGYAAVSQIATANGLTPDTLTNILAEPGAADTVGPPETMRFGSNTAGGYSPQQQELIAGILDASGLLRTMQPGDVSANALPSHLAHYSKRQIMLARGALDGASGFGTWSLAKIASGTTRARVYTQGQVGMLQAWLQTNFPEGKGE